MSTEGALRSSRKLYLSRQSRRWLAFYMGRIIYAYR